MNGLDQRGIPG
jgi:hypothetical protein